MADGAVAYNADEQGQKDLTPQPPLGLLGDLPLSGAERGLGGEVS
jgi:hypothetical protein